jgi:hypothetical protein
VGNRLEDTSLRFEHLFEQMQDIHSDHPETARSRVWYGYKMEEEVLEYQEVAHNDPTLSEEQRALSELDDVLITLIGAYIANGVSADLAMHRAGAKMIEVRNRYASGYYENRPRLKLPDKGTIYDGRSGFHDDYMAEYE